MAHPDCRCHCEDCPVKTFTAAHGEELVVHTCADFKAPLRLVMSGPHAFAEAANFRSPPVVDIPRHPDAA